MKDIDILRPRDTEGRIYIKVEKDDRDRNVLEALRRMFPELAGRAISVRAPRWAPSKVVPYFDSDGERIISAARVERAVEEADFRALCAEQGFVVIYLPSGTVAVADGDSVYAPLGQLPINRISVERSLRAAYFAHKQQNAG